jgi:short-subunit dehydrogenase
MKKKIFLHGGSSLISKYLIQYLAKEFDEFYIFCRSIKKTIKILQPDNFRNKKFFFFENDILNLNKTLNDIEKLPNDLCGLLWVSGYTGNPELEFENIKECQKNLEINFVNIVLCINVLTKKIIKNNESFICVLTSVSGLRGRQKRLFNSAAKGGLINYLSGLRQKLNNKIKVITVIPGYINTDTFNKNIETNFPNFLISNPNKCAEIIFKGICNNKEIIYVDFNWRIIMFIINIIPEKIFKKFNF